MSNVTVSDRIKHAWNAFMNKDPTRDLGPSYSYRPDHKRYNFGNERSIIAAIYTRIAIDVSETTLQHARIDDNGRYTDTIRSGLNNCLNVEANIDQTGKAFMQDVVMSMLDEGVVAIVPVETNINPNVSGSYDITSLRTAKITSWYPEHVRVNMYDERTGIKSDVTLPKKTVAIVENPFYAVMNEPNSTLRRLVHKLNLLDEIDEQSSSGKLDLIIQLPYVIKSESRKLQAEQRRKDIEEQLAGSKYGIAYTDGTEKIQQLNRSVENNLMSQIDYLTEMLYSQLGMSKDILDGTASAEILTNYHSRTIKPIVTAIAEEMNRKFLTKTARTQGQCVYYFSDPFKFIPVSQVADIADKFTRNEIMTSNEFRQIVGMKASDDPGADELRNKNLSQSAEEIKSEEGVDPNEPNQNGGDTVDGV